MKNRYILSLLVLASLSASAQAEVIRYLVRTVPSGEVAKPSPEAVALYYGRKEVPYPYDVMGEFKIQLEFNEAIELESALQTARRQAAQLGADGIILPKAIRELGFSDIKADPKKIEDRLTNFPWTIACIRRKTNGAEIAVAQSTQTEDKEIRLSLHGQPTLTVPEVPTN